MSSVNNKQESQSFLCPGCNKHYDFRICSNIFTGRVPLILHCQHTVCEECVQQNLLPQKKTVKCVECNELSIIGEGEKRTLQDIFSINFYLLGMIMVLNPKSNTRLGLPEKVKKRFSSSFSDEDSIRTLDSSLACELDHCSKKKCTNVAKLYCKDCQENYCENCSMELHQGAKGLMSHRIQPIMGSVENFELNTPCQLHPSGIVDLHCSTCDIDVCSYCMLQSHSGHEYEQLNSMDWSDLSDFENLIESAEQKLKIFEVTKKQIKNALKKDKSSAASYPKNRVSSYFTNLHGKIQVLEMKIKQDMVEGIDEKNSRLCALFSKVEANMMELHNLISTAKSVCASKKVGKINVKSVQKKLEELLKTPCRFYVNKGVENADEPLGDDGVVPTITRFVDNLLANSQVEYMLLCTEELPDDYHTDDENLSTEDNAEEDVSSANSFLENGELLNVLPKQAHRMSPQENLTTMYVGGLKVNDFEVVTVTHINSPDSFYVNLERQIPALTILNGQIERYSKSALNVHKPETNKFYLARYDLDLNQSTHKWYRAQIVDIVSNCQNDMYFNVYFVDYGNKKQVKLSYLREITEELCCPPPFAFHCKLYGIFSQQKTWPQETQKLMAQIIKSYDTSIKVINIKHGVCDVILMVSDFSNGECTSVGSALCFIGHASISEKMNDVSIPKIVNNETTIKLYDKTVNYELEQSLVVCLCHVDQENIFVQDYNSLPEIKNLHSAMNNEYCKLKYKNRIYCPEIGREAVVEIQGLNDRYRWYRCRILKLYEGVGLVDVILVDVGQQCKVSYRQLKKLKLEFSKLECQAIQIKLADIVPIYEKLHWSNEAVEFLSQYQKSEHKLKMIVSEVLKPLTVLLFEMHNKYDKCINALLVENQLADSTGKHSLTIKWPQNVDAKKEDTYMLSLMKTIQSNKTNLPEEGEAANTSQPTPSTKDKQMGPITVLSVQSPDEIYVHIVHEDLLSDYNDMRNELVLHYMNDVPPLDMLWEPNTNCVMRNGSRNEFFRIKILEAIPNDNYKVWLIDLANEKIVSRTQLHVLDPKFEKYPCFAIKCHLDGIYPAGGQNKWTMSACDFVKETLETKKDLCMIKEAGSHSTLKSLPVTICFNEYICGGALEPDLVVVQYLNDELVKNGLAFRKRRILNDVDNEHAAQSSIVTCVSNETSLVVNPTINVKQEFSESKIEVNNEIPEISISTSTIVELIDFADVSRESNQTSCESNESSHESYDISCESNETSCELNEINHESNKPSHLSNAPCYESKNNNCKSNGIVSSQQILSNDAKVATKYKPAPMLCKNQKFSGVATFVDNSGTMYIRNTEVNKCFALLEEKMKAYFDAVPFDEDIKYRPGELCTVRYENDNWYRAHIVKVYQKDMYIVHMTDFGNEETVLSKDLRNVIMHMDVPVLVHKIKLINVFSKTPNWNCSDKELLQDKVDGVQLNIQVLFEEKGNKPALAAVRMSQNNESVSEYMVYNSENLFDSYQKPRPHHTNDEPDVIIMSEDESSETDLVMTPYVYLPETRDGDMFSAEILQIVTYNKVILKFMGKHLNDSSDFLQEIQKGAFLRPVLKDLEIGKPCIVYSNKHVQWLRAEIYAVGKSKVHVWYVDVGTFEVVSPTAIRMISPKWLSLPVIIRMADIYGIELVAENLLEKCLKKMKICLGPCKVEVITSDPLSVRLYDENNELAYQDIINCGVLDDTHTNYTY